MENVTALVADKPVVIFSNTNCCMCHSIKGLIMGLGTNPTVYELDEIPDGEEIVRALQQLGCQPSVPAFFIGEQFVGGAKEIMTLHLQNQLRPLL